MEYTLAILTHGEGDTLDRSVNSFLDKVKPKPERVIVHCDGGHQRHVAMSSLGDTIITTRLDAHQGFCRATGRLWRWASAMDVETPPYVFWLEHDFVFLRPVDLSEIACALDADPTLAQMSLMRTAVSREEIKAGGLYEMRHDDYTPQRWTPDFFDIADEARPWLEHRAYFTTNPSLMRTAWMAGNQWPDDAEPYCEGKFGIELAERGFHFGVWGAGEPWVEHIGVRDGKGY